MGLRGEKKPKGYDEPHHVAFEKFVHRVFEGLMRGDPNCEITRDEVIKGPDGGRQCDVLIKHSVAGIPLITLVECKDYARPVNVQAIDQLASKSRDLNANKSILAARRGFSKSAIRKAERLGIQLFSIDNVQNIEHAALESVAVVARTLVVRKFGFKYSRVIPRNDIQAITQQLSEQFRDHTPEKINGRNIRQVMLDVIEKQALLSIEEGSLPPQMSFDGYCSLNEIFERSLHTFEDRRGVVYQHEDVELFLRYDEKWSLATTRDLSASAWVRDHISGQHRFLVDYADVAQIFRSVAQYDKFEDIPLSSTKEILGVSLLRFPSDPKLA